MRLSQAVSNVLQSFNLFGNKQTEQRPKEYLRGIFKQVMAYSAVRNISGGKPIGKTDPLFGEREEEERIKRAKQNLNDQFPVKELLPDGRHRYFKKYGVLVDRKTV